MKAAKNKVTEFKLFIEYKCPTTNEVAKTELTGLDFYAYESECEMCGGHGGIEIIIYECVSCGKYHDNIELKGW